MTAWEFVAAWTLISISAGFGVGWLIHVGRSRGRP